MLVGSTCRGSMATLDMDCVHKYVKAVSVETSEELGGMLAGKIELPPIPERADTVRRF